MIESLNQFVKMGKVKDFYVSDKNLKNGIKFNHNYLSIHDYDTHKEILLKPDQSLRIVENSGIYHVQIMNFDKVLFSYKIPSKINHVTAVYFNGSVKTIYF